MVDLQRARVLTLPDRAARANEHHNGVERALGSALDHAIVAGEHLIAAKAALVEEKEHGYWVGWLEDNFESGEETAQRYIRIARHKENLKTAEPPVLTIESALGHLATPREPAEIEEPEEETPDPPAPSESAETAAEIIGRIPLRPTH